MSRSRLGQALDQALGDRAGVRRFGDARAPLDEALCHATVDLSGRGMATIDLRLVGPVIGELPTTLVPHFFDTLARQSRIAHPPWRRRPGRPPPVRGGVQVAGAGAARSVRGRRAARVDAQHQGRAVSEPVTVIDYGAGNLASITAGLDAAGQRSPGQRPTPTRSRPPRDWCCPAWAPPLRRWPSCTGGGWSTRSARRSTAARRCSGSAWGCSSCSSEAARATSNAWG